MDFASCISRDCNGFYFCGTFLAKELVTLILTHVDYKSIANCRLVCKQWNAIIGDPLFWKYKTKLENKSWPNVPHDESIPWIFYASIYIHQPFERNLIQNPNGKGIFVYYHLKFKLKYNHKHFSKVQKLDTFL